MWWTPQARFSFIIWARNDTFHSPRNLYLWYGSEETCQHCSCKNPNLQHILSGCKAALTHGQYWLRHDWIMYKLAEILEGWRPEANHPVRQQLRSQPSSSEQQHEVMIPPITWNWGEYESQTWLPIEFPLGDHHSVATARYCDLFHSQDDGHYGRIDHPMGGRQWRHPLRGKRKVCRLSAVCSQAG